MPRAFPPASATRPQSAFGPFDALLPAQPYDVVIVYPLGLTQLEEDRFAPHFALAQLFAKSGSR